MAREKAKVRINPVKFLRLVIVLIVICGLLVGAGFLLGSRASRTEHEEMSAIVVQNQISAISELATVTYHYTELGQYESSKDFYGTKVPFTTSKFIITYEGTIKGGIDMDAARIDVDGAAKKVTVTVPPAKILSHEIHEDTIMVFDEKKSIFNPLTVEDYAAFYADQKVEVESKAKTQGVLSEARTQAKLAVRNLLTPVMAEEWELEIK